jgi:hypothetical protein
MGLVVLAAALGSLAAARGGFMVDDIIVYFCD